MTDDLTPFPVQGITVEPGIEPYWMGTAENTLVLPRCETCNFMIWYPRPFCPACGSRAIAWEQLAGRGSVYSFSIVRRGDGLFRQAAPYVLAYVELDEGPRVMTNIVGIDPEEVSIGQRVEAVFHDTGDGAGVLRFGPARS